MKTLAEMVATLKTLVVQQNGIPSDAQYEQALKDAVNDLNARWKYKNVTTLTITAGTAAYTLPDDFYSVISFQIPYYDVQSGTIVTSAGLIPTGRPGQTVPESYTILNSTLTFVPTPQYASTRYLWYQAIHVLDDDEDYPYMDEVWAAVMMIRARSLALSVAAGTLAKMGQGVLAYRIGAVQVDKGKAIEALRKEAEDLRTEYLGAVEAAKGVHGAQAAFDWSDLGSIPV
ncbi:MAG: hypothetical protein JXA14_22890 [Anaerolineae bacterium]|nr:hypothetical protein [Anaerolineae bacterium]